MSSKPYLQNQFNKLDLIPLKYTPNKRHLFADYFELVCLFSNDELTQNEILARYKKENIELVIIDKDIEPIGSPQADINDKEELWADAIYSICEERFFQLNDKYPFVLKNKTISIQPNLDTEHRIYIFLLLASNLNYFTEFKPYLTTDFEEVSFQSLKNFLPDSAIVKQLGKNSDLSGNAREKIKELAKLMNIRIDEPEIDDNVQGNQERGLDIVGWIPFKDKVPNFVSILGQCACGKEWFKKQGETRRYEKAYYRFYKSNPIHAMFIPFGLIKSSSAFFQSDEVDCLLFERFRIIENLSDTSFFDNLEAKTIIDECIKYVIF